MEEDTTTHDNDVRSETKNLTRNYVLFEGFIVYINTLEIQYREMSEPPTMKMEDILRTKTTRMTSSEWANTYKVTAGHILYHKFREVYARFYKEGVFQGDGPASSKKDGDLEAKYPLQDERQWVTEMRIRRSDENLREVPMFDRIENFYQSLDTDWKISERARIEDERKQAAEASGGGKRGKSKRVVGDGEEKDPRIPGITKLKAKELLLHRLVMHLSTNPISSFAEGIEEAEASDPSDHIVKVNFYTGYMEYHVLVVTEDVTVSEHMDAPSQKLLRGEPIAVAFLFHLYPVEGVAKPPEERAREFFYLAHFASALKLKRTKARPGSFFLKDIMDNKVRDKLLLLELDETDDMEGLREVYTRLGFHNTPEMRDSQDDVWRPWKHFLEKASKHAWSATVSEYKIENTLHKDMLRPDKNLWMAYLQDWPLVDQPPPPPPAPALGEGGGVQDLAKLAFEDLSCLPKLAAQPLTDQTRRLHGSDLLMMSMNRWFKLFYPVTLSKKRRDRGEKNELWMKYTYIVIRYFKDILHLDITKVAKKGRRSAGEEEAPTHLLLDETFLREWAMNRNFANVYEGRLSEGSRYDTHSKMYVLVSPIQGTLVSQKGDEVAKLVAGEICGFCFFNHMVSTENSYALDHPVAAREEGLQGDPDFIVIQNMGSKVLDTESTEPGELFFEEMIYHLMEYSRQWQSIILLRTNAEFKRLYGDIMTQNGFFYGGKKQRTKTMVSNIGGKIETFMTDAVSNDRKIQYISPLGKRETPWDHTNHPLDNNTWLIYWGFPRIEDMHAPPQFYEWFPSESWIKTRQRITAYSESARQVEEARPVAILRLPEEALTLSKNYKEWVEFCQGRGNM